MTNQNLDTNTSGTKYCERKGVFCSLLTDYSVCNSANCSRDLPDIESIKTNAELIEELFAEAPKCLDTVGELISAQPTIYPLYTQAYVDELKKEVAEYKGLYEEMYRKWSELDTKDLNKKYAESIARDYLNKNAELVKQNEELSKLLMAYHSQTIKPVTVETIYEFLKSNAIMMEIPHGSEPAEEDVLGVMWWQIAKYFKEKFNVGDYEDE